MRLIFIFLFFPLFMEGQTNNLSVEHLSMLTTPIYLLKGDSVVSQGTGFYLVKQDTVNKEELLFLITNYHVITGSAPNEGKQPIGDNIMFLFHKNPANPKEVKQVRYPLFTKTKVPVWKSSTKYKDADIAIIPLPTPLYKDCSVFAITEDWAKPVIKVRPTSQLTLVGYPYGYYDTTNSLPIWKTGSVASEPNVDFDSKPLFVIDISAFPGMSGSPAFVVANGAYEMESGPTTVGRVQQFMGIYASMQMLNEKKFLEQLDADEKKPGIKLSESLELGHVWKASLIFEIVNNLDIPLYERTVLENL